MFKLNFRENRWAYFFCSVSAIGALVYGYDNTYYNGVLAMTQFKNDYGDHYDEDGNKALNVSFTSLTASCIYIGDALGALISAPINDKWGRKVTFWFASFCILFGGIAQVADTHYEAVLVFGRILIGLGMGQCTVTSLLYIGEVAPVHIRGPALMMFQFLQSISQLIASGITQGTESIDSSLSYKIPMGGLIILPLMLFAGLPFIPESPVWYVSRGRQADASHALKRIHKGQDGYEPTRDLTILNEARDRELEHQEGSSWTALIKDPIERRKVICSAGALYAQQICGILFFYVYGVVFAQAIGIKQPFMIQLITNILQIFAVAAAVVTGNKVRRRHNLLITTGMMFLAFIVIGGIGTQKELTTSSQYVIVVFSFVIIVAFNYGLGPLAYTVAREMAVGPNQNKIMSFSVVFFYFITWLVSFTAPYMYYSAGWGPMLGFFYAGTTLTSLAWVWFCVGETSGRTTLELSLFFEQKIPVRQWRTHVFPSLEELTQETERRKSVASMASEAKVVSVREEARHTEHLEKSVV
jgi:sugar porter (SP) family MFS transporter